MFRHHAPQARPLLDTPRPLCTLARQLLLDIPDPETTSQERPMPAGVPCGSLRDEGRLKVQSRILRIRNNVLGTESPIETSGRRHTRTRATRL